MIKLVYCLHRNPALSRDEFQHYWLNNHAILVKTVAKYLGAHRYVQSHTIESMVADNSNAVRGCAAAVFDGITEFWWRNESDMLPAAMPKSEIIDAQRKLLEDEGKFIDLARSVIFMTQEHVIYSEDVPE